MSNGVKTGRFCCWMIWIRNWINEKSSHSLQEIENRYQTLISSSRRELFREMATFVCLKSIRQVTGDVIGIISQCNCAGVMVPLQVRKENV